MEASDRIGNVMGLADKIPEPWMLLLAPFPAPHRRNIYNCLGLIGAAHLHYTSVALVTRISQAL
jgi:hypothetical protein